MLGLESTGVILAYVFCILSGLVCVVYGIVNWNRPPDDQKKEIDEEITWEKEDTKIAEKL